MIHDDIDYLAPGGRSFTITSGMIAGLNKRSKVLEIACGRGEAACTLVKEFGCKVEGFDIDPKMIAYAKDKAYCYGIDDRLSFEVADGKKMTFGKGNYNMILAEGGALSYVGREAGIKRCAELLKEGGFLALTDLIFISTEVPDVVKSVFMDSEFKYLNEFDYRKMLEKNGFEIIHLAMLPPSAWDRYYMSIRRKLASQEMGFSKKFRDVMGREMNVYYDQGGMQSIGYVYIVARLANEKRVMPADDMLRVPVLGMGSS